MSLLLPTKSITYKSPMNGRIIDMRKLCGFLIDCFDREKLVEFKEVLPFRFLPPPLRNSCRRWIQYLGQDQTGNASTL
jgi:hypothetical protein